MSYLVGIDFATHLKKSEIVLTKTRLCQKSNEIDIDTMKHDMTTSDFILYRLLTPAFTLVTFHKLNL